MNDFDMQEAPAPVAIVDQRAERSVLGGIMLEPSKVWQVIDLCRPDDFADPAHASIFEAITELANESKPLDVIAVGDHLRRTHRMNARLTFELLHELTTETPTGANADYYARIVSDLAKRRRLQSVAAAITDLPTATGDVEALIESAREAIDAVSTRTVRAPRKVGATMDDLVESLSKKPTFEPTPWPALDAYLGGFRPGALYVVAARPGVGKSVVALQIARTLAEHGPVGFVSLEMPEHEIQKRLVSSMGTVSMESLMNQQMTDTDWKSMALAASGIRELELFVRDDLQSPMQAVSFARTLHRKGRMQALVIDYLQLMRTGEQHESRTREVEAMTGGFKQLAQRLDIPVVLLSQLNRQGAQRKGKAAKPRLEDLRDSGSIEQDADCVILLHREEQRGAVLEVSVAKNRHGRQGDFALSWEGQYARAVPKKWSPTGSLLAEDEVA